MEEVRRRDGGEKEEKGRVEGEKSGGEEVGNAFKLYGQFLTRYCKKAHVHPLQHQIS